MNQLEPGMVSLCEVHEVPGGAWAELAVVHRAVVAQPLGALVEAVMYASLKLEATYICLQPLMDMNRLLFTIARQDGDKPLAEEALRDWLWWVFAGGHYDMTYASGMRMQGVRRRASA